MMKASRLLVLLVLFFGTGEIQAQTPSDVQLWIGAGIEIKLNKKLSLDVAPEIRFDNRIRNLKSVFSDLGLKWKWNKFIAVKANYRYSLRPTKSNKQRFNADFILSFKKKKKPLSFRYRFRYQYGSVFNDGGTESYLRQKIRFKYNLSKLVDPFISQEIFFKLRKNEVRNLRFSAGLSWRLSKKASLSTAYTFQREVFVNSPTSDHMLSLSLGAQIGKKKKKKK